MKNGIVKMHISFQLIFKWSMFKLLLDMRLHNNCMLRRALSRCIPYLIIKCIFSFIGEILIKCFEQFVVTIEKLFTLWFLWCFHNLEKNFLQLVCSMQKIYTLYIHVYANHKWVNQDYINFLGDIYSGSLLLLC